MVPTCEGSKVAVHVIGIFILDALLTEGAEGNWRGMQTGHVMKQSVGGVASHCAKLYNRIKRLCCDYGSWQAAKIGKLLCHLSL